MPFAAVWVCFEVFLEHRVQAAELAVHAVQVSKLGVWGCGCGLALPKILEYLFDEELQCCFSRM